jgi:hypothetical protein
LAKLLDTNQDSQQLLKQIEVLLIAAHPERYCSVQASTSPFHANHGITHVSLKPQQNPLAAQLTMNPSLLG